MSKTGLMLIVLSLAVTAYLFSQIPNVRDPIALFSQFLGSVALIMMAWAQLMATRLPFVEPVFGGMDRVYVLHKWSGVTAMTMLMLHDTIDAEMDGLGRETLLVELGETLGELSLYGLLILAVISVATFIPYHMWRWTHRVMGVFFAGGAFHYMVELKPFDAFSDPVGLVVTGFCAVGLLSYAYTLMPAAARRGKAYEVTAINRSGGATEITLNAKGRGLRHQPGQFAVFHFGVQGLTEPHPFSLCARPNDDRSLRITAKPLGDFTHRLCRDLAVGTRVRVQGPFGRFTRRSGKKPEVWVAGGIGITPFLAWAEALDGADTQPVHLFWAVRSRDEAPLLAQVEAAVRAHPSITLHLRESADGHRVTPELIASAADMTSAKVWFCGPATMRRDLMRGLAIHGLSARRFHYEEFEFRTGVGMKRLAAWLGKRLVERLAERGSSA